MSNASRYAIVVPILIIGFGCSEPADKKLYKRMTSEELGYWGECSHTVLSGAISTHTGNMVMNFDDEFEKPIVFPSEREAWRAYQSALKETLPPDSLLTLHKALLVFLQAKIEGDEQRAKRVAGEADAARDVFMKAVSARQPVTQNGSVTKFVYSPPLPVGQVSVDDSGRFRIETGDSINTPIGSFGATKTTSKGVTRLIIRSEGKQRFFRVDRPFQVFVPTDYGFDISGDGDRKLTIDVRKK